MKEGQSYIRRVVAEDYYFLYDTVKYRIKPIYGDAIELIEEWIKGDNYRSAWLAFEGDYLVGLLCLKNGPEKTYLKISTLFIFPKFWRKGKGTFFLKTAENFARLYGKSELRVTVSEERLETLEFFKAKGFEVIAEEKGKYKEGVIEYILEKRVILSGES